jgi:predicted metal-dependent hydrolase
MRAFSKAGICCKLIVIAQRVQFFASQNGFQYTKVRISLHAHAGIVQRGTLSFTWRLVMAPLPIIDYVVVHELVHLHTKNHSREFWEQVKLLMPDYQQRRLWLKENANSLYL